MKRNEVREGNIVENIWYDVFSGKFCSEIISININDLIDIEDENDYKPVPLTEEWMKIFSIKENHLYRKGSGCYSINFETNRTYEGCQLRIEFRANKVKVIFAQFENLRETFEFHYDCEYVHELQNIYYTLKKEELTFNLKQI